MVLIPAAIRAVSYVADTAVREMKGRAAFEMAEMHFNACDMNEACRWFKAVESLAPGSPYRDQAKLVGPTPTAISATPRFVAVSITETVLLRRLAT